MNEACIVVREGLKEANERNRPGRSTKERSVASGSLTLICTTFFENLRHFWSFFIKSFSWLADIPRNSVGSTWGLNTAFWALRMASSISDLFWMTANDLVSTCAAGDPVGPNSLRISMVHDQDSVPLNIVHSIGQLRIVWAFKIYGKAPSRPCASPTVSRNVYLETSWGVSAGNLPVTSWIKDSRQLRPQPRNFYHLSNTVIKDR